MIEYSVNGLGGVQGSLFAATERLGQTTDSKVKDLISIKLDSWTASPVSRLKDKADVVELIKARQLRRELAVAAVVQRLYWEIWDGLQTER